MEEKRQRRAAKEAKRKAEERAALRTEIEANFMGKGVSKAVVTAQEIVEVDGNGSPDPVVGAVGGLLGQLIITLALLEKNFNR